MSETNFSKPWENIPDDLFAEMPWEAIEFYPVASSGRFAMCEFSVDKDTKQHSRIGFVPKHAPVISYKEMNEVYDISGRDGVSLVEACVKLLGKESFVPSWLESSKQFPKVYHKEPKATEPVKAKVVV